MVSRAFASRIELVGDIFSPEYMGKLVNSPSKTVATIYRLGSFFVDREYVLRCSDTVPDLHFLAHP